MRRVAASFSFSMCALCVCVCRANCTNACGGRCSGAFGESVGSNMSHYRHWKCMCVLLVIINNNIPMGFMSIYLFGFLVANHCFFLWLACTIFLVRPSVWPHVLVDILHLYMCLGVISWSVWKAWDIFHIFGNIKRKLSWQRQFGSNFSADRRVCSIILFVAVAISIRIQVMLRAQSPQTILTWVFEVS